MNWHRTLEIALFDLRWAAVRRKGLMFILPYFLFWFLVLRQFYKGAAYSIQTKGVLLLSGIGFDIETLNHLFIELPPSMSAMLIGALYTTPFFTLLAANDLFASDLGSGYFRFLITRCQRVEIFLGRCLGVFFLILVCTSLTGIATALIAYHVEGYAIDVTLPYLFRVISIMVLYAMPFIAVTAIFSALLHSAIGVMLLASVSYTVLLISIYIAQAAFDEPVMFLYLLPSGIRNDLISLDNSDVLVAIASIPAYSLIFGWLAWVVFKRRNF